MNGRYPTSLPNERRLFTHASILACVADTSMSESARDSA